MTADRVHVGDVLKLQRRSVTVQPDLQYEEIGVRSFGRGIFHKVPVSGVELGNKRVFRIEPGDLVLSNVFAWEGAIAVASGAEKGKIGSHRFMTFVPHDHRIDTTWAAWFFRSEPGLELIRKASPGSAGRNRTLAVKRFEALEIPLPPIDEQRRTATHLDRLEARISLLHTRATGNERLTRAMLPAIRHATFSALQGNHRDLGDVAVIEMGQSPPGESYSDDVSGMPLLNGPTEFGSETPTPVQWTMAVTRVAEPGDLLICVRGATTGRMNWADQRYCIGRGLAAIRADSGVLDGNFLRHALHYLTPEIMTRTAGSTFANLPGHRLASLSLPLPDLATQRHVARRISMAEHALAKVDGVRGRAELLISAIIPASLNEAFGSLK